MIIVVFLIANFLNDIEEYQITKDLLIIYSHTYIERYHSFREERANKSGIPQIQITH